MLIRIERSPHPTCTPGVMSVDGNYFGLTLELPWKENKSSVSSIPAGKYRVALTWSPRFQRKTLEVMEVPGRNGIRLHPANTVADLRGCIGVSLWRPSAERIKGDLTRKLQELAAEALKRGEAVTLEIINPEGKA